MCGQPPRVPENKSIRNDYVTSAIHLITGVYTCSEVIHQILAVLHSDCAHDMSRFDTQDLHMGPTKFSKYSQIHIYMVLLGMSSLVVDTDQGTTEQVVVCNDRNKSKHAIECSGSVNIWYDITCSLLRQQVTFKLSLDPCPLLFTIINARPGIGYYWENSYNVLDVHTEHNKLNRFSETLWHNSINLHIAQHALKEFSLDNRGLISCAVWCPVYGCTLSIPW